MIGKSIHELELEAKITSSWVRTNELSTENAKLKAELARLREREAALVECIELIDESGVMGDCADWLSEAWAEKKQRAGII